MGMVRQWQEFFYEKRYAMSYVDALPDFVALTQSYGHTGIQIDKPADVRAALEDALSRKDELVFLNCFTDKTENVYPMIPAGAGLNEMILV
jgi:acetolactate synthase-1/2/3 large subunit